MGGDGPADRTGRRRGAPAGRRCRGRGGGRGGWGGRRGRRGGRATPAEHPGQHAGQQRGQQPRTRPQSSTPTPTPTLAQAAAPTRPAVPTQTAVPAAARRGPHDGGPRTALPASGRLQPAAPDHDDADRAGQRQPAERQRQFGRQRQPAGAGDVGQAGLGRADRHRGDLAGQGRLQALALGRVLGVGQPLAQDGGLLALLPGAGRPLQLGLQLAPLGRVADRVELLLDRGLLLRRLRHGRGGRLGAGGVGQGRGGEGHGPGREGQAEGGGDGAQDVLLVLVFPRRGGRRGRRRTQ